MAGGWFWWFLAVIVWVAIAFWPARVAGRKGHSFVLYFLFSLVFFPAALIGWPTWSRTGAPPLVCLRQPD